MRKTAALLLTTALTLTGCGGGGSSEPQALVPLSSANYDGVAVDVISSISGTGPVFSAVDGLAASGTSAVSPYAALGTGQMGPMANWALKQVGTLSGGRESAMAVTTEPGMCVTGSALVTTNDADNNNAPSAGDSVTLVANQCVFELGQPAVSGTLAMTVNAASYSSGVLQSATIGMRFTDFTVGALALNGGATVTANDTQVTLAYNNLSASLGNQTLVYDYTLVANSSRNSLAVNGRLNVNGSVYGLSTPQPVTMGPVYPNGGTLKITDGHGAYVLSNFSELGYINALYLAGDALVDAQSDVHLWSAL